MTPEILDFIPGLFVETDKYIEVEDEHFVTLKQIVEVHIKCVTTMENPSLLCYIVYYWHQTSAIDFFPLLC